MSRLQAIFAAVATNLKNTARRLGMMPGTQKLNPAEDILAEIFSMETYGPSRKERRSMQTAEDREQRQSRARIKRDIRRQRNRWNYAECIQNYYFTRTNKNELRKTA